MASQMINSILNLFITFGKYVLYFLSVVLIPLSFFILFWFIWFFFRGYRLKKRKFPPKKPHYSKNSNLLSLVFLQFPKRFVLDLLTRDPDAFPVCGVHIFAGEQGSGKTVSVIHFILSLMEKYPSAKVASNIQLDFDHAKIEHWSDILNNNNGSNGEIVFIDEIQNWFSSLESKDFPPDMLTEITQQRKQRKIIVGTSQVFTRISKPIREQISLLYEPLTFFGCLTFVRVYKLILTDEGTVDKKRYLRSYGFVHDDYLRNCYNTYEKVQRISVKGFVPRSEQLSSPSGLSTLKETLLARQIDKKS